MEVQMTATKYSEAQKMILFIKSAPFSDEDKNRFTEETNTNGLTDESVEEIRQSLLKLPKEAFKDDWERAKYMMDFGNVVKQWQMALGSKKFKRNR
jgi:hypothetical protein